MKTIEDLEKDMDNLRLAAVRDIIKLEASIERLNNAVLNIEDKIGLSDNNTNDPLSQKEIETFFMTMTKETIEYRFHELEELWIEYWKSKNKNPKQYTMKNTYFSIMLKDAGFVKVTKQNRSTWRR